MAAVTICSDSGAKKNKVWHCFCCFPIFVPWSDGTGYVIFVIWMSSFKSAFSLPSLTFIKRLLSSSSLSAIRVVPSAYLRSLAFLLVILIPPVLHPAQHFAWCTLHRSQISRVTTQSPEVLLPDSEAVYCSMSVRTVASWPTYRFCQRRVRWSGIPISLKTFHSSLWATQSKTLEWSVKQK